MIRSDNQLKPRGLAFFNAMPREPDGEGRMAIQKKLRGDRGRLIAKLLLTNLDLKQVEKTTTLFPRNTSLRKRKWRRALRCLSFIHGRVYAKKLCCSVVKRVARCLPFQVNLQPGTTTETWVEAQADRMRRCARAVRKMVLRRKRLVRPGFLVSYVFFN